MKFSRPLLSQAALCLCLCACSAPKLYDQNRQILSRAVESLEQGRYEDVTHLSDQLVFATGGKPDEYQVQRFFAAYLNAQAHMAASYSGPFLKDPEKKKSLGIGSRASDSGSTLAHMVAVGRGSGYGLDWLPASASEATLAAQLPESLVNFGVTNASDNLTLGLMTIYTRLGFNNKVTTLLKASPELLNLDSCKAMLGRTNFLLAARPWVMYMVFHHLRESDEPMAFSFAAEALFNGLDSDVEEEMQRWITSESSFNFTCPVGDHAADPSVKRCNDEMHLREFISERKS